MRCYIPRKLTGQSSMITLTPLAISQFKLVNKFGNLNSIKLHFIFSDTTVAVELVSSKGVDIFLGSYVDADLEDPNKYTLFVRILVLKNFIVCVIIKLTETKVI